MGETPLQEIYRKSSEYTQSYNYFDLDEGAGYVIYYGYSHKETTTKAYSLSKVAHYPFDVETNGSTATTTEIKVVDLDFDIPFNTPKILKGKLKAIFTTSCGLPTTANTGGTNYWIVKVRKWDGANETEIASAQGQTNAAPASTVVLQYNQNIEVNIATPVLFKSGETLRITFEGWGLVSGANGTSLNLHHDPMDRVALVVQDEGGVPQFTQMQLHVPFQIR